MNIDHRNCTHPATKAGRIACRKDRAAQVASIRALESYFAEVDANSHMNWLLRGAAQFTDFEGTDTFAAASALFAYFAPSGDEAKDNRRRANGYIITTDPGTIRSTILRRNS